MKEIIKTLNQARKENVKEFVGSFAIVVVMFAMAYGLLCIARIFNQ
jgi:hypothetical protein